MTALSRNRRSANGLTLLVAFGAAAVLGVTATPAAAAGPPPRPGAPGLGDRLYPLLGNGGYDVRDYDLRLRYPKKDPRQTITGDVTITAVATQLLSRFDLDFGGGSVAGVSVNGRRATFTRSGDELVITPKSPLPKRKPFRVTVTGFTATPVVPDADAPVGFVTTPDGTVLAGQPASSHLLFPSNDHPRDKATYTIRLTAPTGWTATANGTPLGVRRHTGYAVSTFRESRPMASELVQLAVGDFLVHQRPAVHGVRIRDVVPRRLASTLLPKAAIERDQLAWMERQVGPYPFENYGSLVIDGDLGFALETQTLSLYDTSLFGAPTFVLNPVMAHELAHQWFGDSVAPRSWSDVWQNEGHATWYELLYAEQTGVFKQYTDFDNREALFKAVYALGDQWRDRYGPVARPAGSASIWDVFNPNVYHGGALALYALEQKIGADRFRQLEREWVRAYQGRSVSTDDFIALASRIAHRDLSTFLIAWLYGSKTPPMPGHPDWVVKPVPAAAQERAAARAQVGTDAVTRRLRGLIHTGR
ncbi:M1 family metallopeptidase [Krasilnikovia sp. M28-CT-15]|uniref:M1 family metallopeptidase n=1 Tax=Krasilnikovia sp. M28-CT-15 TaxID=3373540 RepID=UPI0038775177